MVWRVFHAARHYAQQQQNFISGARLTHGAVRGVTVLGLALATQGAALQPAAALQLKGHDRTLEAAVTLSPRRPLIAHVRFCILFEDQCIIRSDRRAAGQTSESLLQEVTRINQRVNRAIRPKPDVGFDSWEIGVTAGDCEDYALQKRKELMDLGWPSHLLRIAITRTEAGVHHAVLLVRIGSVDYALDNLTARVLPWDQTPYEYLMVQSAEDPKAWWTISPTRRGVS